MTGTRSDRLAKVVGTSVFIGHFPIFPGTVGSLPGILIYVLLSLKVEAFRGFGIAWLILLAAILLGGSLAAHRCEELYGNDDKKIVIDEVWGMLIALQALPLAVKWIVAAFFLFRFFDIVKPPPARKVERVGGGVAIMLDDGVAGIYTAFILYILKIAFG